MNNLDKQYLELMQDILDNGAVKDTRAGKVRSVFGRMLRFNLNDGLPILTTKKVFSRGCIVELLWFLSGDTNIKYLVDNNVHIWDDDAYRHYNTLINKHNDTVQKTPKHPEWDFYVRPSLEPVSKEEFIEKVKAGEKQHIVVDTKAYLMSYTPNTWEYDYKFGDLGPVYGKQWRSYGYKNLDQIKNIIESLKNNPDDRRMLCIAYNPDVLDEVALPPCHMMFQFYSKPLSNGKRELSCCWTQRSVDLPLGWPINVMSYSILTHMIAQCVGMGVGEIICSLGDVHIYENQVEACKEQLKNDPLKYELPKLWLNPEITDIDKFTIDDIKILNYESYQKIHFPLSVG